MNFCILLSIFLIILLVIQSLSSNTVEGYRGRRRKGRKWYGDYWGYRYRPPPPFRRWRNWGPFPFWGTIPYWNAPFFYTNSFNEFCPTGCSNLGRGRWGCTSPGNGPSDCQFASDCAPCGY